jgi:eukaryotic-like serine/threonine-protein kinase
MALAAGTRLGPYEIIDALGAGGMGEVYRGRDTRLDRTIAIKILPAHLSSDTDARQRLEREARAISALNHPNICTLHDVGHQDGVDYLVMEFLEGETLADRLMKGSLPLEQVLKVGIEICAGLEKAHLGGVLHRDLKPGNIMLTKSGAKLMDFGLAKAMPAIGLGSSLSMATMSHPLTAQGTVVGTFQYMAPEQMEGKEADVRSDIFALGAVLYEMATGKRAFGGKTTASVIAAVLERDPAPISKVQRMSPLALDRVVGNCLAKDPEDRWHSVHDVRLGLQGITQAGLEAGPTPAFLAGATVRWLAGAFALMAIAIVFLVMRNMGQSAPQSGPVRASLLPPANSSFSPYNFALSPDGTRLAFVAVANDGSTALWVRSLASGATQKFANTAEARFPFWSPEGQWLAFFATGKLRKLEIGSGAVQTLCDARSGWGGDWSRDNVLIFASEVTGPLLRVSAAGGAPSPVTKIIHEGSAEAHRWPSFLPDGKHFLYAMDWAEGAGTYVGSLDGGESKLLAHDVTGNVHIAAGHLVYVRSGSLVAQSFEPQSLKITGEPIPIAAQDIEALQQFSHGNFSVSQAGALVYLSRTASLSQLEWFDRNGKELGAIGVSGASHPRLSLDGRFVAYSADPGADGKRNVWVYDMVRKTATQLTDGNRDGIPVWSPDGKQIVYAGIRGDGFGLFQRAADGSGKEQVLAKGTFALPSDWSHDGQYVLYMTISDSPHLFAYPVGSTGDAKALAPMAEATLTADGKWIAFTGYPEEVFVQLFSGPGGRIQITTQGGAQARWRGDGKELFYIGTDKKLIAVSVQAGKTVVLGTPHALFQTRITGTRFVWFQYDVTPDGQRFLINSLPPENTAPPLTLVLNWNAELKKK